MAMNVPHTEEEQLTMLASTQNADLLQLISNPTEAVIRACLEVDGNAIRHLIRPTLDLQLLAVKTTPFAIEYCSPQKRLKVGPVHASIQREAFDQNPMTLVYAPECFDESLDRHTKPGIRDFAQEVIASTLEEIGDAPLTGIYPVEISEALRTYASEGKAHVPILQWYKTAYPKQKRIWKQIEGLTKNQKYRVLLAVVFEATKKLPEETAWHILEDRNLPIQELEEMLYQCVNGEAIEAVELPTL